jgi:hypothetical protein
MGQASKAARRLLANKSKAYIKIEPNPTGEWLNRNMYLNLLRVIAHWAISLLNPFRVFRAFRGQLLLLGSTHTVT